jgi:hypothetical protein
MDKRVDMHQTAIASSPMPVASGELVADFPQALETSLVDIQILQIATGDRPRPQTHRPLKTGMPRKV